jgi:hypothetical protein
VRSWFAQLRRHRSTHTISRRALHRVADGLTISAHHYLTDPDTIEQLGLLAP